MLVYGLRPVMLAGKGNKSVFRVVATEIQELRDFARKYELRVTLPPRTTDSYKHKTLPRVNLPTEMEGVLAENSILGVSEEHFFVVQAMLRQNLYETTVGERGTAEGFKILESFKRGKVVALLMRDRWVDEPEDPRLENLQQQIETIDLGRRNDLNYGSNQAATKYLRGDPTENGLVETESTQDYVFDPDFKEKVAELSPEERADKPWLNYKP